MLGETISCLSRCCKGSTCWLYDFVSRWADLAGTDATDPMFQLRVMGNNTGSTIIMSEGECGALCVGSSYSNDVIRWMNGDNTCEVVQD